MVHRWSERPPVIEKPVVEKQAGTEFLLYPPYRLVTVI
jgi:hypothetical protein